MSAQVAADLRAAAEVLRRDGWTQGGYFDGRRCCQAGALLRVIEPGAKRTGELSEHGHERWWHAQAVIDALVIPGGYGGTAIEWNDEPDRTADEVIAALLAAADAAEAQS